MSTPRKGPHEALSPEELAGYLDQQNMAALDSEGPALAWQAHARPGIEARSAGPGVPPEPKPSVPIEPVRETLPTRRETILRGIRHGSVTYCVEIGLRPETGLPAEIFITAPGPDEPNARDHALLQDAATLISLALQYGITTEAMRAIVGHSEDGYASILGAVLEEISRIPRGQPGP
jgi:hypothetical protein